MYLPSLSPHDNASRIFDVVATPFMQVVVHFTTPVNVNMTQGSPVLLLRMDSSNTTITANSTDDGVRYAKHVPGLTQFVDVGVDALR